MTRAAPILVDSDSMVAAEQAIARLTAATTRHDVEVDGTPVCWRSIGQGSPLVLVHGGHGCWLHWACNVEALAQRYTVWVPDLPSYGDSGTLTEPADLQHLAEVTLRTMDHLVGAGTAIRIAGFSFGGLVASHIAARRGNIAQLALLGSAGHGTPRRQSIDMVNWRRSPDPDAMLADLHTNLRALMIHDDARIDAVALYIHRAACVRTRFRSRPLSLGGSVNQMLAAVDCPMLFAWGEHDVTGQPELAGPALTQGKPNRSWETIADAGHWVQFEQAEETNRLLLRFFD